MHTWQQYHPRNSMKGSMISKLNAKLQWSSESKSKATNNNERSSSLKFKCNQIPLAVIIISQRQVFVCELFVVFSAGKNVIREGTAEQEREMLKSELLSLNQLLQTERENSHAELAASSAGMQRALRVLERKNESLKQELESVKGQNAEQLKN